MGWSFDKPGFVRLRNGEKAYVYGLDPFNEEILRVHTKSDGFFAALPSGLQYANGKHHDQDVVAEWKEPKRIKGWVNIYDGDDPTKALGRPSVAHLGHVYPIRADADHQAIQCGKKVLACIEIDVVEGQGLDGSAR